MKKRLTKWLRIVAGILIIVGVNGFGVKANEDLITPFENFDNDLKSYAYEKCEENGISFSMFMAVAYNESRFTVGATNINTNGTKDRGLCQINDSCINYLTNLNLISEPDDLYDGYKNIDCFIALMNYHNNYTKDENKALLRYQVGEGAYKNKYQNGMLTNETYNRVINIKNFYEDYIHNTYTRGDFIQMTCKRCNKTLSNYQTIKLNPSYGSTYDGEELSYDICMDCLDELVFFIENTNPNSDNISE